MYKVYVRNDDIEYPLYEPLDEELRIFEPVLSEEIGSAGSFSFQIYKDHPNFDKIKTCMSEIVVYQDGSEVFAGRAMKPDRDFDNKVTYTCEGILTYLLDSIQRPVSITGNIRTYFSKLLEIHNSQVEEKKRFELGNIVVTGNSADTVREITDFSPTLTELRSVVDLYGGYLHIRTSNGIRYLDYVWDYGGINDQPIRFGENLLDLTEHIDPSEIITCLIPRGATVEYQDDLGETQTRVVDITSVNDGKDYIENESAVAAYGYIWGSQTFEDVTDPEALLTKAKTYLEEASALPATIEISALDLSLIDTNVEAFCLGFWTNVISRPHGIEQRYLLSSREINLLDPTQGRITLGRTVDTMTGTANKNQAEISNKVQQVADSTSKEINRKIENATTLITGGFGGYVVLDNIDPATGEKIHPWRILVMNTPDKDTATNIIQINQNGIGFSTTGINGTYRNAWTIDGNLVADFVTTGTMLADRIRGGTLEVGGKGLGKNGIIKVLDTSGKELVAMSLSGITINSGNLNAPKIIGGSADFGDGFFYADDEEVGIGGFYAKVGWGRDIFQSADGQCGMSAASKKEGNLWFWAGWKSDSDYDFCVNNKGEVHARDFYIETDQGFWDGWGLNETIQDIYSRLEQLEGN